MSAQPEPTRFREDVRVARAPAAIDPNEKVFVWPHLLSIELVAALLYTAALSILSILVNPPLEEMANPQHTPNPSKAPWYFLGLQELLLHMHPSLAGVIVPSAVLVGLMVVPYIDRERTGIGIYWSTPRGASIFVYSAWYTALWVLGLIFFDNWFGMSPTLSTFANTSGQQLATFCHGLGGEWFQQTDCGALVLRHMIGIPDSFSVSPVLIQWIIPTFFMLFIPWSNLILLRRRFGPLTMREIMLCLYSYMFTCFWVLIIVGTAFRGEGMKLVWPWMIPPNTMM